MVAKYYVVIRPQTNDIHSVHKEGCPFLQENGKSIFLGSFRSDGAANHESRHYFTRTTNCLFCCKEHRLPEEKLPVLNFDQKEIQPIRQQIPVSDHQIMLCSLS